MFSPGTLGMIGAVTGIVGATTGLAGLVFSWINYQRAQQIKALDLRLELRKQVCEVRAVVDELADLLQRSRKSRLAVRAAKGSAQSGAVVGWIAEWESDLKAAHDLAREVPNSDETYQHSEHPSLETKLVEVHALATKAARLRDKYQKELASDDREREDIRADIRARPL
jgi:hypothetical protein